MVSASHNSHHCTICNIRCGSAQDFATHLRGERHSEHIRTNISIEVSAVLCTACNQHIFGEQNGWQDHCRSRHHKESADATPGYTSPAFDACTKELVSNAALRCNACNLNVSHHRWRNHASTQRHLDNAARTLPTATAPPPPPPTTNAPRTTPSQPSQTKECTTCGISMQPSSWDQHIKGSRHRAAVAAQSGTQAPPPYRPANTSTSTPRPPTGYQVRSFWRAGRRSRREEIIPGIRPSQKNLIPWKNKLDEYPIPEDFEKEVVRAVPAELTFQTYVDSWRKLMLTEEIKQRDDLSAFDLRGTRLMRHGPYYHVTVPGLAEKRPSVMVGDSVGVRPAGSADEDPWFEGYVHYVHKLDIALKFSQDFRHRSGLYNVRFELNRTNMRRMYQALFITLEEENAKRILFPRTGDFNKVPVITENSLNATRRSLVNTVILDNPRQLIAVTAIRERPPGAPPLIIWGPPGTGKTSTAVEGIRQILLKDPDARVLACAPSNSAADAIATSLKDLGEEVLFRLNAPSRPVERLPFELHDFSSIFEIPSRYPQDSEFFDPLAEPHYVFSCPPKGELGKFRVVVSTSSQSGVPAGIGLPRGHFSHILIDEAAQALEPEVMIAIKTMADSQTNIILCGDHKQLRPVVFSPIARVLGYGMSFIERLVTSPGYNIIVGNAGVSMVRLNQNFRSHPSLVEFPSERIYDNELRACGPPEIINSMQNWHGLPKRGFPIIFHNIKGVNLQPERSPSWYNMEEVKQVKEYMDMLTSGSLKLTADDIGIISPYQAQCQELRKLLHQDVPPEERYKIGSVEEFQGDERKVIIVSTVRSDTNLVKKFDKKHGLGFVAQESRLTVAITRAMALLIVVGDASVLSTDTLWGAFLTFVRNGGGWRGEQE